MSRRDDWRELDPELVKHAKKYQEALANASRAGSGAAINLSDPTTRACFIAMRAELDPWARTIDRLNAAGPVHQR